MSSSPASPLTPIPSVINSSTIAISIIFPVLSLIALIVRYQARRVGRQKFRSDDWWIIITWIVTFAISIDIWVFAGKTGINTLGGNLIVSVPEETQGLWISSLLLQVCLTTVKISILCFYRRIFSTQTFRRIADVGIALIALWGTIYFFLIIFQEDPVSGAWTGKGRAVVDSYGLGLSRAITSMILDILVLCFPVPAISQLHMQLKRKIAVMLIFWLGAFVVVAAALRLVYVVKADAAVADSKSTGGYSAVAINAKSLLFVVIEPNCSIIAACLPCYGPLLEGGRLLESLVNSVRSALSLGSRRSESSRGGSNKAPKSSHAKLEDLESGDGDSQIELRQSSTEEAGGQSSGRNMAYAQRAGQMDGNLESGIEVTRTWEMRNDIV